jgi:hypothetical protein
MDCARTSVESLQGDPAEVFILCHKAMRSSKEATDRGSTSIMSEVNHRSASLFHPQLGYVTRFMLIGVRIELGAFSPKHLSVKYTLAIRSVSIWTGA